jgi:hypothetical protein
LPNRRADSRFFLNESSKKLVLVIFLSLNSFMMYSVACPEGSMIRGYRLNLFSMIAFSVHRSSDGKALACHLRRSSGFDKYSVLAMSGLYCIAASVRCWHQVLNRFCL